MQYYNHSLKSFSSFALDANAQQVVVLQSQAELLSLATQLPQPYYILGGGSNTLFVEDYPGTIICPQFKGIDVTADEQAFYLHVASGESWHQLVCYSLAHNMPGLENLALIPGHCGAAPIQNIGAYGVEFADICDYVDWFDFASQRIERMPASACQFGYRDSIFKSQFKGKGVICGIGIKLNKAWQPTLNYAGLKQLADDVTAQQVFDTVVAIRQSKLPDPDIIPNAGSFFKNPIIDQQRFAQLREKYPEMPAYQQDNGDVKLAAGWLIDQCQLKGYQCGGAAVHLQQALVLTNRCQASGRDVINLAKHVQQSVLNKFAIELEPEVRFIGAAGEMSLAQFK